MTSAKTSKPDKSAMKGQPLPSFDKLYWLRIGFAVVAGLVTGVYSPDYVTGVTVGIAVYLATYYFGRFVLYRGVGASGQAKIYTTGVGSFSMVFLFTWMLLFTLQVAGYPV